MEPKALVLPTFIFELIWNLVGHRYDNDSILIQHKRNELLALWYPKYQMYHVYFHEEVHIYWNITEFRLLSYGWDI